MARYGHGPPTRVRILYPPFGRERYRPPPKAQLALSERRRSELHAACSQAYRRAEDESRSQQRGDALLEQLGDGVAAFVSGMWNSAVAVASGPLTNMEITTHEDGIKQHH